MRTQRFIVSVAFTFTLVGLLMMPSARAGQRSVHEVRGHGLTGAFGPDVIAGLPEGGNSVNQVSINAWQDLDGSAHGVIEWTWDINQLPGGGGQGPPARRGPSSWTR